jgi:hypothetical protein
VPNGVDGSRRQDSGESNSYYSQQWERCRLLLLKSIPILMVSKQEAQALYWAVSLVCFPSVHRRELTVVYNPNPFKEDGLTTQTIYLKSNDLGTLRKTICLVAESMRGWPANAHP